MSSPYCKIEMMMDDLRSDDDGAYSDACGVLWAVLDELENAVWTRNRRSLRSDTERLERCQNIEKKLTGKIHWTEG